jgi:hypothetical protein
LYFLGLYCLESENDLESEADIPTSDDRDDLDENIGNWHLLKVLVENHLPITVIDKILKTLRRYKNPLDILMLPKKFYSVIGQYPKFTVKNIDGKNGKPSSEDSNVEVDPHGSQFIYLGIKESLMSGSAKYSDDEAELKLSINIDGLPLIVCGS